MSLESSNVSPSQHRVGGKPVHVITRRAVSSWVLYDLANTIFAMGIVSVYFPLWVGQQEQVGLERKDWVYGITSSIAMATIFVLSPLLGAMTDCTRRRMPFLMGSTFICVSLTALFGRFGLFPSLFFFALAYVAYSAGTQFYDALLPEVSTEENRGRIGGIGVGIGYLGSYIAIGLGLVFAESDLTIIFGLIALAFTMFALPCFLFVKERGNPNPRPVNWDMIRNSTRNTLRTLRSTKEFPGLLRFLIGRVFYTDAINTVIAFMGAFVLNVALGAGLDEQQGKSRMEWIMMLAITLAIGGGFFWGWLTDRLGPKRVLSLVLTCWVGILALGVATGLLQLPLSVTYVVAGAAGFCLGGVWSADRPYMLRLTPPWRIGEFYGLYGMVGRFSAITGPALWSLIFWFSTNALGLKPLQGQGLAILSLLIMVCVSLFILRKVSDAPRDWSPMRKDPARPVQPA